MSAPEYVFTSVEERRELDRLQAIEREFDPASRRRLAATGLGTGWRCLEVGPGAGSLMMWMGEIVGPSGHVTGLDLSTKFLPTTRPAQVAIQEGDIRTVPVVPGAFDLIHARYVLIHLSDYEVAFDRMLTALKPGGWIVLEEPDFSVSRGIEGTPAQLTAMDHINQAIHRMYESRGMDSSLGRRLLPLFQRHGLRDLSMEHGAPISPGRSGLAAVMAMSAVQLRERYLATGLVSEDDLRLYGEMATDPKSRAVYYATVAVAGQKPVQ
ncbi:MAG: methyltransferase domain-containing protein [Nitrospira sp.]